MRSRVLRLRWRKGNWKPSMKLLYAVSLAALVFETTTTFAADIPVAETSFKASAPVSDWTGFYLGAGLGFRSTTTNANVNSAIDTTRGPVLQDRFLASNCYIGFPCITGRPYNTESYRFSPYFGYNWQANSHWVLGVEADVAFGSQTITTNNYYPATAFRGSSTTQNSFSAKADWDASIRARDPASKSRPASMAPSAPVARRSGGQRRMACAGIAHPPEDRLPAA